MFRQIMIPLSGSAAAESAIGYAERLVSAPSIQAGQPGTPIHIHLLRVVPPVLSLYPWAGGTYAVCREHDDAETQLATSYLDRLQRRLSAAGVRVCMSLLTGSLVPGLLEYERRQGIDLVVLASHARTGTGRLGHGSLLHPLLRRGPAPLLVVPPAIDHARPQRALIPLDGTAGAEQALTVLGHLAPRLVGEVTLLRVVDTREQTFEAYRYLSSLRRRPELAQVRSRLRVECGDPTERIADLGRDQLVVLTEPRHWQPSRWFSQSVADRLIRHRAAAVLIARQGTRTVRDDGSGAQLQISSGLSRVG